MIVKTAILILLCLCSGCSKSSEERSLALDYGCDKMWFADSSNTTAEVGVLHPPTCIWDWKASDGTIQLFPKGNYHVQEINLYFLNLQKNIEQRIMSFKQINNENKKLH